MTRRLVGRILSVVFGMAGLVFLVAAFVATWDRTDQDLVPPPLPLLGATGLVILSLVTAAAAWLTLLEGQAGRGPLLRAFFTAQLGKYIPGAVWQAVGQIGLTRRAGTGGSSAAAAFAVSAICQAAAAGTVGATVAVFGSALDPSLRVLPLAGVLLIPVLHRSWMRAALARLERLLGRALRPDVVPAQPRIIRAYGWNILGVVAQALAFASLLSSLGEGSWVAAPVFAVSWLVGFLALPVPAGIGIREAVLIALLRTEATIPAILAAAVALRLITMAAELLLLLATLRSNPKRAVTPTSRS